MRKAFAMQKLFTCFFSKKYWFISDIFLNFNVTSSNNVVSFDQPAQFDWGHTFLVMFMMVSNTISVNLCSFSENCM